MLTKANTSVSRSGYKFRYQILPETGMSDACGCGNQVEKWKEWKKIAWFTTVHDSGYMGYVPWQMACCVILSSCFRLLSEGHLLKSVASFAGDGEESMKPQNRQCFQQLIMFFLKKFPYFNKKFTKKKTALAWAGGRGVWVLLQLVFWLPKIFEFLKGAACKEKQWLWNTGKEGQKSWLQQGKAFESFAQKKKVRPNSVHIHKWGRVLSDTETLVNVQGGTLKRNLFRNRWTFVFTRDGNWLD